MLIEDQELRELYAAASTEHLDNLEAGVLVLEKSPGSMDGMKELLRAIHSLKGDSRMLGVENAESLAQLVEALLKQVAAGQCEVTPELGDRFYWSLDALREVVREAVNGIPVEVDLLKVMTQLMEAEVVNTSSDVSPSVEAITAQPSEEISLAAKWDEVLNGFADTSMTEAGFAEVELSEAEALAEAELQAAASLTADALEDQLLEPDASISDSPELVESVAPVVGTDELSAVAANVAVEAHQAAMAEGLEIPDAAETTPEQASLVDAFFQLAGEMAAGAVATEADDQAAIDSLLAEAALENAAAATGLADAIVTDASSTVDPWTAVEHMVGDEPIPGPEVLPEQGFASEPIALPIEPSTSNEGMADAYDGFIDDDELRGLYEAASGEHLAALEMGCLQLEKSPEDFSQFKALLRAAHSLKGDSRMLGVEDAEALTHQLESLLQEIEQGQRSVTPALCDRLYAGIDGLRQIAHGAVHGPSPQLSLDEMMSRLMGAEDPAAEATLEAAGLSVASATLSIDPAPATVEVELIADQLLEPQSAQTQPTVEFAQPKPTTQPAPSQEQKPTASPAIDTIRVASSKLDTLVTQVSELAVTKRRIVEWSDQVTAMLDLWEGWSQDAFAQRNIFSRIQDELAPETAQLLTGLQEKNLKKVETLGALVQRFRSQTSEGGARLDSISNDLEVGILNLRMLPLSNVFNLFPRMLRDLSKQQKKDIELLMEGGETPVDKRILEEIKDPLSHLLRNAVDHGIEQPEERAGFGKPSQASLRLRGFQRGSSIVIEISDDGRGLDLEKIKQTAVKRGLVDEVTLAKMGISEVHALIFEPGFSTKSTVTAISGRGVGMDVVKTNIERLKGSIVIDSTPGQGCTFRLTLNPSLATTDALILGVNNVSYALPIESVDRMVTVDREDIFTIKGNLATTIAGEAVSVAWLSDLLDLPTRVPDSVKEAERLSQKIPCIVVQVGSEKIGLFVDELRDQQEILLKRQSKLLKRVRNIAGSTILGNGEVCLVLNHQDLFLTTLKQNGAMEKFDKISASLEQKNRILLVEDSLPIRTQMKRILEGAGYLVTATVDGLDGYNMLRSEESSFDAIISDVEMPNLTGLELAIKVRSHSEYDDLPFILITTLAKEEDKKKGFDAGANSYITKGDFDQNLLLDTLQGLIRS